MMMGRGIEFGLNVSIGGVGESSSDQNMIGVLEGETHADADVHES